MNMIRTNSDIGANQQRFYILVGDKENWEISIEKKLWGFTKKSKGEWNTTKPNDLVAFYVTSPVKKIIGFGIVTDKLSNEDLVWMDEKRFKRSLWQYKIHFDIFHVCKDWKEGINIPSTIFLQVSRRVIKKDVFLKLVNEADTKWNSTIHSMMKPLIIEK